MNTPTTTPGTLIRSAREIRDWSQEQLAEASGLDAALVRKAEALKPGAQAALEKKALQLMGGASSAAPPPGKLVYSWHIEEGRADIFLAYCTATREAQRQSPGLKIVAVPRALAVGADYGLTVIDGAPPAAYRFAMFILSAEGQRILAGHGFGAPNLP